MKFMCSRDRLNEAISIVQKAVSTRSTLPILDGILIEASVSEGVKLTGYDLETGIEAKLEADIKADGSVVINSKLFGEIVRKLPEEFVTLETDDRLTINIECGSSVFSIKGLSSEGYPKIPEVQDAQKVILMQGVLRDMIRQTIFAVSTDESRPTLNGCFFICDGFSVEMVAIDGFRLALRKQAIGSDLPVMKFIVPGKALHEAGRILDGKDAELVIYSSQNHILLDTGKVRIVSRLIQGEYMNYKAILPKSGDTTMLVSSAVMLSAIERASLIILSEDRRSPVQLTMPNDEVLVISASTELGTLREEIPVSIRGERIDIDFNPRYFIDALRVIEDEEITIQFSGSNGPCVLKPTEGDDFAYLVLPLRR
ncbi:MAG: DNA polymerase III subunit beta [Clostridiaceae bacterium]|jgi:DNA polymerase-3 subunit beta|nr:DNA polymerase III subunit beta [Oscillospiraceae bacterium]NLO62251.1 DNA polymerase III subunit beta [Clostridiaceae bacterium]